MSVQVVVTDMTYSCKIGFIGFSETETAFGIHVDYRCKNYYQI